MILEFNLLGRMFGNKQLCLQSNKLVIENKKGQATSYDLTVCKEFAIFNQGMLGSTLNLNIDGTQIKYKFLRSKKSKNFESLINKEIAAYITEYLRKALNKFNLLTVVEYPRDSRLGQITTICDSLYSHFSKQQELWRRHLAIECIDQVREIISFIPIDADILRERHEKIQLEKRQNFFDSVESNPLTLDQRLGVLRSNDRNMVLAAAGTGKTSVIVAKTLDLIDRGLALPTEILVLAYNRSAAEELKERLVEKAEKGKIQLQSFPHISTFHALGRKLLRDAGVSTHISVFTEDETKFKQWVTSWLEKYLASDEARLLNFISLFPEPVNPFDFRTQGDYERYVRDNELRTLNGERVRGYQELLIANYLYTNGIDYAYEAPYVSRRIVDIGFDYRPDFYIKETCIYIEHFGIDRKGRTRPDIDAIKYNESIQKKRELHAKLNTKLIETFHYEWTEDCLIQELQRKLIEAGVKFNPLKPEDILKKLQDEGRIAEWSELMKKALQAIRVERLTAESIFVRLEQAGISQPKKFTELLDALHKEYIKELSDQNSIDFDDMIIRANQVVVEGKFMPVWKHVLVDEFQDISAARMEFISGLIDKGPQPILTVVGDDWQSIYRFSGGKLELTTRFGDLVGAYTSTKLQKTFRYNNSIADTAGEFIMENPEQYKKQIKTHSKVESPQVYLLDDKTGDKQGGVYERVKQVVEKIRANDENGVIAIIARYNYLLADTKTKLGSGKLQKNVKYWSFHKSKGLEADYCLLIGFFHGKSGFPNENRDEAIIEALLPSLDSFLHSEERRLFYVGLTRARKKSYIIADPTAPSSFVTELLAPKYDINIVSRAFQEQYRRIFKCPNCEDGYLRLIEGKFGGLYSCSTGLGCKVGKARVCLNCCAPSIDGKYSSICNNVSCRSVMNICEKCGRPMKLREGNFGKFLGCTGYGIKNDQCCHTRKI